MIKKAIILSFTFFALSLYTLYTANKIAPEVAKKNNPVVLELFTSQGCSSCPPADALLDQVKSDYPEEVIALSYHVDYWNYIGWEDPFSDHAFTEKQKAYAHKFDQRNIYTPQMVVNGKEHFVGSNRSILQSKIQEHTFDSSAKLVEICETTLSDGVLSFTYNIITAPDQKWMRALLVIDERETMVNRGENRNRKLKNSNIVVAEKRTDLRLRKNEVSLKVPDLVQQNDGLTLVVIVENQERDILGAAQKRIVR